MKLENIKVGDKLYWYTAHGERQVLEVEEITKEGKIFGKSNFCKTDFHPSFFRGKLVPKRKRRVIWVNEYKDYDGLYLTKESANKGMSDNRIRLIKFIEAKDQS